MMLVVVEFSLRDGMEEQFESALDCMHDRVKRYGGLLGEEPCCSLEDDSKFISLFYWRDRESIKAWREDPEHVRVQELGREKLLKQYKICVCEIEREYGWEETINNTEHQ